MDLSLKQREPEEDFEPTPEERVAVKIAEVLATARRLWPDLDLPVPSVRYDCRGARAGAARAHEWTVRFNRALLERHTEQFLARTVPHELAHLIVARLTKGAAYRVKHHGPEWRHVMRRLGAEDARRCHDYDITGLVRRQRRFTYVCRNGHRHEVATVSHNRIRRHGAICRLCNTPVLLVQS